MRAWRWFSPPGASWQLVVALSLWVAAAGCGQVTVGGADDAAGDTSPGLDGAADGGADAALDDATDAGAADSGHGHGGDTGGPGEDVGSSDAAADAEPADTGGTAAPKAGEALLVFESSGGAGPAAWRAQVLNVYQSAAPGPGKAYVWWAIGADGSATRIAVLPYEDVPYVADFTAKAPIPTDAKVQPLAQVRGALVSWEDEVVAATAGAPSGPTVWRGEWPTGVWVHLVHSLAAKAPGATGYLQDASAIALNVEENRKAALAAFSAAKVALARTAAERAYNALVGLSAAKDLNGNGQSDGNAAEHTGLQSEESPLKHGLKHIGFAADAWPGGVPTGHPFAEGRQVLESVVAGYATKLAAALPKIEAFAKGTTTDFKEADLALQGLSAQMNQAVLAGVKLATLPVVVPK